MSQPEFRFSSRARRRQPSVIRELMPYMEIEDMISLGGGYPNPQTFAYDQLTIQLSQGGAAFTVEGEDLRRATQYGPTTGLASLIEIIRRWHAFKDGIEPDELMVLNGSQEGLYILADLFLEEGDEVALSDPTYPGGIIAFRSFTERFLSIPLDGEGLRVDLLSDELARRRQDGSPLPRLIYTIPNGHNPAGVTLSEPRRRALVALAREYEIPIVEDDPYQLLRLDDAPAPPTLQSLAPDLVIRLDSFSKILCPGLRLGYATGPAPVLRAMALYKQAANLQTGSFVQGVLTGTLRAEGNEGLMERVARNVAFYRRNRDAMVEAARVHLPETVSFQVPDSGMFIWFELPEGLNTARMIEEDCARERILLVPGYAFSLAGGCVNAMRASYSMVSPERIEEGINRFAIMIRKEEERVNAAHRGSTQER